MPGMEVSVKSKNIGNGYFGKEILVYCQKNFNYNLFNNSYVKK